MKSLVSVPESFFELSGQRHFATILQDNFFPAHVFDHGYIYQKAFVRLNKMMLLQTGIDIFQAIALQDIFRLVLVFVVNVSARWEKEAFLST